MIRPQQVAIVALIALLPAFAGCIGSAAATAAQNRSAADEAALAWDESAQLAQVIGAEGSFDLAKLAMMAAGMGSGSRSADFERASSDEEVGDGRAEVWVYRYVSTEKPKALLVALDREGNILRQAEETRGRDFSTPVGSWSIDSNAALDLAKAANDGLAAGAGASNFGIVSVLHRSPTHEHPRWLIAGGGGDLTAAGGGYAEIDAVTGEVLASKGGFGSFADWARQFG